MATVTPGKVFTAKETDIDHVDMNACANPTVTIGDADFSPGGTNTVEAVPVWIKAATVTYDEFTSVTTSETITLYSLPARGIIHAARAYTTIAFAAPGPLTDLDLQIGISGLIYRYMTTPSNVMNVAAVTGTSLGGLGFMESATATTSIIGTFTATGDTLNDLTAGSVDIYLLVSRLPSFT